MSEIDAKIIFLSIVVAAILVSGGLLMAIVAVWLRDIWLVRKVKKEQRSNIRKAQVRREKEREARRSASNDEFSRGIWEMLNEY